MKGNALNHRAVLGKRLYLLMLVAVVATHSCPMSAIGRTRQLPQTVDKLPPSSERWALVIGVSKYDDSGFNSLYGQNDAKTIAEDLRQFAGFADDHVILLTDDQPDDRKPRGEHIWDWLTRLKARSSPSGLLFVFFSGHGMEIDGEDFLIPQDLHSNSEKEYLKHNAISVPSISQTLRDSLSQQIVVVVDACRANAYAVAGPSDGVMTKKFAESFNYEDQNSGIKAYATILSASPGQSSLQYNKEGMGYFSWVLDQSMRGAYSKSKPVTLKNVVDDLEEHVPHLVTLDFPGRVQRPFAKVEGFFADRLILSVPSRSAANLPRPSASTATNSTPNPMNGVGTGAVQPFAAPVTAVSAYQEVQKASELVFGLEGGWTGSIGGADRMRSRATNMLLGDKATKEPAINAAEKKYEQFIARADERRLMQWEKIQNQVRKAHSDAIARMTRPGPQQMTPNQLHEDEMQFERLYSLMGQPIPDPSTPDYNLVQPLTLYFGRLQKKLGDYTEEAVPPK